MRNTAVAGLAFALVLAGASVSQAQQPTQPRHERQGRQEWMARRGGRGFGYLLRGITLTDKQKAELKDLRKKDRDQAKDNREDFQKFRKEMQEARAGNDTSKVRELREKAHGRMEERREHNVKEIREILTPDQRTIFDKNVADAQARMQQRGRRGGL